MTPNYRLSCLAAVASLAFAFAAHAQVVQNPFTAAVAGLPAGGAGAACTTVYPTSKGANVGDGCLPSQASLNAPSSNATDSFGNIYISDYGNRLIRVIYQGGPALTATLIAANPQISNFTPIPGHIYTLAGGPQATLAQTGTTTKAYYCNAAGSGTVALSSSGDGCPATQAYVQPRGMTVDANGNLFFANLAGGESLRVLYAGGAAVAALITNENPTVVPPQPGFIYTLAGSTTAGFKGDGGNARAAAFENVRDVAVDAAGNVYISDGNGAGSVTNNDVRVINAATGNISTFAGNSTAPQTMACPATGVVFSGDGGPASAAMLNSPYSIFFDASGNLYLADSCNGRLRAVYAGGKLPNVTNPAVGSIYTVAGGGTLPTGSNVAATQLSIALMQSAGIDQAGNIYFADNTNRYAWTMNPNTGIATLFAGIGTTSAVPPVANPAPAAGAFCAGTAGPKSTDSLGDGCPALQSAISPSLRFTGDNAGRLFSIESGGNILRGYSTNDTFPATALGAATTQPVAFNLSGTESFTLQGATSAEFADAGGQTCNPTIAPVGTLCIYNVTFKPAQAGVRSGSLRLGTAVARLSGIGSGATLAVDPSTRSTLGTGLIPQGVTVDLSGNVYVADGAANQVVQFAAGATTGTAVITGLKNPHAVAIDGDGALYVADTGNNRVVQRLAGGTIAMLGSGLAAPQGLVTDAYGNIYIADTGNNRVVELVAGTSQTVLPITGLSGPTGLALDAAGDLFVADSGNNRVVELPLGQAQVVVALGSLTNPTALATDTAGDLYVASAVTGQVVQIAPGATVSTTLLSGLAKPVGLATDATGSLFIADTSAPGVLVQNRALGAIAFPLTNVGQSSTTSISVTNTGNAALTFPGPQFTTATGTTANFAIAPAASNGCSLTVPTAPSTNCLFTATFTPPARGASLETATFVSNAGNTATAHALLSGTGAQLIPTTTTVTITSGGSTVTFGTVVPVSATITLSTPSGTPTGTITLSVDGQAQPAQAFGTGTVTTSLNLPVGTHVVSVAFSGDTVYASSSNTVTFIVTKSPTTTVLTLTPSAPGGNPTITFAAAISAATGTGQTGTVSFYSGAALLGTSPVAAARASLIATNVSFASATFTAVYSGDGNFTTSTSAVLAPAPDFAVSSPGAAIATAQGGVAQAAVTLTPLFNLAGAITPSCTGLPANSVCRFAPTTITLSGNTPVGTSVEIYTNVPSTTAMLHIPAGRSSRIALALLAPGALALAALGLRRRLNLRLLSCLAAAALLLAASGLAGCSSSNNGAFGQPPTPPGTSNITVTFTSAGATPVSHSLNFTLTVNTP